MRFFKYLTFSFLLLFSTLSYSLEQRMWGFYPSTTYPYASGSAACNYWRSSSNIKYLPNDRADNISALDGICYGVRYYGAPNSEWASVQITSTIITITCPSATEVTLKVPVNAQKYQCVKQCQYALRGCVDIDFEPGMTCSAISTGIDCGGTPPTPPKDPSDNTQTPDAPTDTPAAPGQNTSGTNTNTATSTGTSSSTSTTTTNTSNNTSTTTTTTTNNNTTTIDLSSLESTIESVAKILGSKIDAIKEALGGDSGSENGSPDGTDLTETNSKLDDIKENGTDLNDWLKVGKENGELGDKPFGTDETPKKEITTQTLKTNIFGSSSACPADRTLSMNFLGRSFQKTFSFSLWCEQLAILGSLILISAYLFGAYIIASKS